MKTQTVNRRNILKSAAVFGAMILGRQTTRAASAETSHDKSGASPFVETRDGASLYYKDWGRGPTILFVHSWAANSDLWQYQMHDSCANGFRSVAYDRRGHGRSSQPWDGYDFDTLAADLNEVIESLRLERLTLVAHSMGCGEVVRYLTKYSAKRVSKIVLASPTLPYALKTADNPDGADGKFLESFRHALKTDVPGTLKANAPSFFGANPRVSPELMNWAIEMCRQTSLRALLECSRANAETDFRAELKNIRVPALIVHGDRDVSAPPAATAQRTAGLLPNAKLKIYKDAPHGIVLTHKDEFARDLLEFLKS